MFVGVNDQNDDCIFGVFFYDGANIEIDWIRQIPTVGGYVRDPRFIIDNYDDVILIWNVYNSATSKWEKIQINKFPVSTANTAWTWSKTVTVSGNVDSIKHAGISLDVFGNYTLVTDVIEEQNQRYSVIHYLKYDGTVIKETKVDDTANIGFHTKWHTVDNSGDCILAVDRQQSDQLAAYRFNDENDRDYDFTKQDLATMAFHTTANAWVDTSIQKFGAGSLKLSGIWPVKLPWLNLSGKEWR